MLAIVHLSKPLLSFPSRFPSSSFSVSIHSVSNQGCCRASLTVILCVGSTSRQALMRSMACGLCFFQSRSRNGIGPEPIAHRQKRWWKISQGLSFESKNRACWSSTYHNDSFITLSACRRSSARTLWHQRQTYLSLAPQGCLWPPPRERCSPGSRTWSPWLTCHPYQAPECALVQSRKLWLEAALLGPSPPGWAGQEASSEVWGQRGWCPASECTAVPPRYLRHKPEAYPGWLSELVSVQTANKTSVKTWNGTPPGQKSATMIAINSVLRGQE